MYYGEKGFMKDNQTMRDYFQSETEVTENWKVSERFKMKQKLEWHATWLQQQING